MIKFDMIYCVFLQCKDVNCIDVFYLFDVRGKIDLIREYVGLNYNFLDLFWIFKIIFFSLVYFLLYYVVLVCELCVFGVYKNVEKLLELYVYVLILFDLWSLIFCCWIYEYGWLCLVVFRGFVFVIKVQVLCDCMNSGWVVDVLRFFVLLCEGLFEYEVLSVLMIMGYVRNYEVIMVYWEMFCLIVEYVFIEMLFGLLIFFYQFVCGVIEIVLLGNLIFLFQECLVLFLFKGSWE